MRLDGGAGVVSACALVQRGGCRRQGFNRKEMGHGMTPDKIADARAAKQYAAIRGFYIHCFVYVLVSLLLVLINVLTGGNMWAHWAIGGWGIGVLAHAYSAFVRTPRYLAEWEAEAIKRELPTPS